MKRQLCAAFAVLLLLGALTAAAAQTVVSQNKSYTLVTPASSGYPDDGTKLTDGKYGTPVEDGSGSHYYRSPGYVGFHRNDADADGNFVILLDLGEKAEDLTSFELGWLNETDVGIFAPRKVEYLIGDTANGTFVSVGSAEPDEPTGAGQQKAGIAVVAPESPAAGRYVRCVITPRGEYTDENGETKTAAWTFTDELTVLQGKDGVPAEPSADTESSVSRPSESVSGAANETSGTSTVPATGDGFGNYGLFVLLGTACLLLTVSLLGRRTRQVRPDRKSGR